MIASTILQNVRVADGAEPVDLALAAGRIAELGPALAVPDDAVVVDGRGGVVIPGLVDAHCHLDKTLWGQPWEPHGAGAPIEDRIRQGEARRAEFGLPHHDGIHALLARMVGLGTTLVRTHTDVDPSCRLDGIAMVAKVAAEFAGAVDVEQVAFPQGGLLTRPGTAELLAAAVDAGATVVGGIDPSALERNPVQHLETVFTIAAEKGAGVDIHLHERGTLGAFAMELTVELTEHFGLQGRVTLSHAPAIAEIEPDRARALADRLAAARVSLATATPYNTPVLPIAMLAEAGVVVASGNDGIRDLWGPWGTGSMLERVHQLAIRSNARRDDQIHQALATATDGGRRLTGRELVAIAPGSPADLVVLPTACVPEAVAMRPAPSYVVKGGVVVARDGVLV
ncbi:amidohydrolase [Nocardioides ginsengisoli]|uniref:Amidohydrolase n=1 Tax=Nocardioides ginsengisoli TaxID=363868 RepID=A0ABW3W406_9ACTN